MTERLNITESEYRAVPLPSYSLLKRIDESGPRALKYAKKYDSEAIDFGSLLDCKLLCPEEFNNKFYFDATEKPTAQLLELAEYLCSWDFIESVGDLNSYIKNNVAVEALSQQLGLFGGVKDYDKRVSKFDTDLFWNYIQAKIDSSGKTVFTPDTLSECVEAEIILKTHPNTAKFFRNDNRYAIIPQMMLTSTINGYPVKAMLDLVCIDNELQTITPYDLKATEMHQKAFKYHFQKMKYYLQGALYKEALSGWIAQSEEYSNYSLEDFKFIVYSRSDKYPFVWNMGLKWHENGLNGFINSYGDREKGVYELLDEYNYYVSNPDVNIDYCFAANETLEL